MLLAANLLSLDWGLAFWTAVTFLIVLYILARYAWKPIVRAMEEREHTIEESLTRAEKALEEARRISEENERIRRQAEIEAQRILREAREAAEKLRQEEIAQTREQIRLMMEQAQVEIEQQKEAALKMLRAEVASLAVKAAEKILQETLDEKRHRKLVEQFIEGISTN